jgi:hypothetical protein
MKIGERLSMMEAIRPASDVCPLTEDEGEDEKRAEAKRERGEICCLT